MIQSGRVGRLAAAGFFALWLSVQCQGQSLWDLANEKKDVLRISTLFDARNVRDNLASEEGIKQAVEWCKQTGVTHVFIETFRDNYTAERPVLERAKARFKAEGFDVSGCVTPTKVGKLSGGRDSISCYTNAGTQKQLQEIFEYAASLFHEIMIDDFLFTDCQCDECKAARGSRSWAEYRCDLMVRVSRERILGAARAVNPAVKIIIKYPQWYEEFHNRGYEVLRETADYDRIWVGTETRDYNNKRWGGDVQYKGYYIMRWLGEIGGAKCGGGWFDPFGTTQDTYVEQARQTVLADAKEMLLFCYGALLRDTGPANVEKLRAEIPGLFKLAQLVRGKPIKGIIAPKPPNSDAFNEQYVFDFVGMLGLPLVPTANISSNANAAFLSVHSLKDPALSGKLQTMLAAGSPVLMTDGLAERLGSLDLQKENVVILKVNGKPRDLLSLTREQLKPIRDKLLAPFGMKFDAPNKVGLYLIGDNCLVVENFNDKDIDAAIEFTKAVNGRQVLVLPAEGKADLKQEGGKLVFSRITPRTLVVLEY